MGCICGAGGVTSAFRGGEWNAQVVELLFCAGKLIGGGFECLCLLLGLVNVIGVVG